MPQIQIPDFVGHNQAREQGRQNALLTQSSLKTAGLQQQQMGMQNQLMSQDLAKRAELEALLQTSQNPDRDGFEWAKRNNPDLAMRLEDHYIKRFGQKASLDLAGAAKELENATGERIEYGERFAKIQTDKGEVVFDKLSQKFHQVTDAKGLAQLESDLRLKENSEKHDQALNLEAFKQQAPGKGDTSNTPYEDFRSDDPVKRQRAADYLKQSQQRVQMGMPQFVGIQDGQAAIYQPQRGGAGKMATVPLPGQGPLISRTEGFDEGRAVINAKSGLRAAAAVRAMLADKNILAQAAIPGSPGARKFAAARKEMIDVLTRLRTGAALNREEEDFYAGQAPTVLDLTDTETIEYKIKLFEDLYNGIVNRRTAGGGGAAPANPQADSLRQKYNY